MHTVPFHLTSPPYIFPALITRERKINQTVAVTTLQDGEQKSPAPQKAPNLGLVCGDPKLTRLTALLGPRGLAPLHLLGSHGNGDVRSR